MKRSILVTVAVALLAILAAVAIGTYAYQAGVASGLAEAGRPPATGITPYAYHPVWHGPFFFGGPLVLLLLFFLFFGLLRWALWGGRWGHAHGPCGTGGASRLEEWHRRAHEAMERGAARV